MSTFDDGFFEEIDGESFEVEEYEALRNMLTEDYLESSYAELHQTLTEILTELSPEESMIFKNALRSMGRVASKVTPAVGGLIGEPVGAVTGQVGSQLIGRLAGGHGRRRRSVPRRRVHTRRHGTRGRSAAGQLLRLVCSPAVTRVLGSLLSGGRGRGSIRVGGTSVPIGGLLNLLGSLAGRATQEAAELHHAEGIPDYLVDDNGEAIGDLANPDERADMLWERMEQEGAFEVSDHDAFEVSEDFDLDDLFEDNLDNESIVVEWH